ncbi:DUF6713 family protein [Tahibacter amnicola]|uniref:Uncharacterized protein n=1 Tax=Tahibacter amnicola TaxID=2976241 RepID=A0ABY6BKB4_9GAMM|nr:DUF6713 family protein [Tahibacter amnicola]UXI70305.1 hypothetical protein N4264_11910 [Tahibacter amnicola]
MITLNRIAALDMALVFAHQGDAAYWHEWEMFHLPGGIQAFDVFNVVIFATVLMLFIPVVQRRPEGYKCSMAIAALCATVLPIHVGFALAGFDQFHLPVSLFLIGASFVAAITHAVVTWRARHEFVAGGVSA